MTIALAGMMGCGKSSVGRELSKLLSLPLVDLDAYIERREGLSIPEIFQKGGEPEFREIEFKALEALLVGEALVEDSRKKEGVIISLGGGTLTTEGCRELIENNTFCIYLEASEEELFGRLCKEAECRPMLKIIEDRRVQNESSMPEEGCETSAGERETEKQSSELRGKIKELLERRRPIYEGCARLCIATDGRPVTEIAAEIASKIIIPG